MAANSPARERPPWSSTSSYDRASNPLTSRESSYTSLRRRSSQPHHAAYTIDEEDDEDACDPFLQSLDDDDDKEDGDDIDDEGISANVTGADDHFDPAAWLNRELDALAPNGSSASAPLASLDSGISTLLTKASVARTELSDAMDQEMARASQNVPKIASEIAWIGRNAGNIKTKLERLNNSSQASTTMRSKKIVQNGDSRSHPAQVQDPLAHLADIYTLHSHLASYRTLLRLASSWSTLSADVSSLLSEALAPGTSHEIALTHLSSASLRLREAQDSLNVFGDSEEGQDKAALLGRLIESFEASVRSQLVSLIPTLEKRPGSADTADQVLDSIKTYSTILAKVDRRTTFAKVWRMTRLSALLESWSSAHITEEHLDSRAATLESSVPVTLFLPTFLAELPSLLSSERLYASALFPDEPITALDAFATLALESLNPTLSDRINRIPPYHGAAALPESLKVVRVIREKGRELERLLTRAALASSSNADGETFDSNTERRNRPRKGSDSTSQNGDISRTQGQTSPLQRRRSLNRRLSRDHAALRGHSSVGSAYDATPANGADLLNPPGVAGPSGSLSNAPEMLENKAASLPRDFAFSDVLYSALLPIWNSYPDVESRFFEHLWNEEKRILPSQSSHSEAASSGLGDEHFRDVLEKLQRSWTIVTELSEDATARCLELTRGIGSAVLTRTIDGLASRVLMETAEEVERACRRVWDGLIYSRSSVASGREWTAFGRVASLLKGLKKLSQRVQDLHNFLVNELKESAGILNDREKTSDDHTADKLTKLHGSSGAGINGPAPTHSEVRMLLNTSLLRDLEQKQAVEMVLGCVSSSNVSRLNHSHPVASSTPRSLPMLPLTSKAVDMVCAPVVHSLLVLPLVPMFSALAQYGSLSHWSASTLPGQVANEYQLSMPSFSLGPTETMQSAGEGILGLVRELEGWLADEGVVHGVGILTSPVAAASSDGDLLASSTTDSALKKERRRTSMLPEAGMSRTADSDLMATSPKEHRRRSSLMPMAGPNSFGAGSSPSGQRGSVSPQPLVSTSPLDISPPMSRRDTSTSTNGATVGASEQRRQSSATSGREDYVSSGDILPDYLAILLRLLTNQLLNVVLPHFPPEAEMSAAGWKQLQADMDYLQNVVGALALDGVSNAAAAQQPEDGGTVSMAGWKDCVGIASSRGERQGAIYGYQSAFALDQQQRGDFTSQTAEGEDAATARSQTPSRPGTQSLRQMLQSQRRGAGTPRSDSPVQKGKSGDMRPEGEQHNNNNNNPYTVDFNAMNVGMGW